MAKLQNPPNVPTGASVTSGAIALQSEGTPIQFKNITLTPLGPAQPARKKAR